MNLSNIGKTLLAASAVAGIAVLASAPGSAATVDRCAVYAQNVADDYAPAYRGPVVGIIVMPFDVTSALLTGRTSGDFRWKRAYDTAYADCAAGRHTTVVALAEPMPRAGSRAWIDYCSAKYRSFNPDTGTYMTYSGQEVPCR